MEMIDRYLHAVRTFLPTPQQEDIIRELSDDLATRVEDREAELGRPLTLDEQAAVLQPYGHPMLLAARYGRKQYLIGPAVYPFYVRILKLALVSALFVHVVLAIVFAATGAPLSQSLGLLGRYPGTAIIVLGWMTLVFVVIDAYVPRLPFLDKWTPRSLPPVPPERSVVPRVNTAIAMVVTAAGLCWWLAVPGAEWLALGPATSFLALGPGWDAAYAPMLALMVLSLALQGFDFARPSRTPVRSVARILVNLASVVLMLALLRIGNFVVLADAGGADHAYARLPEVVNLGVAIGLFTAAIVTSVELARDVMRLRRVSPRHVSSLV